eukprot:scaffold11642_cov103-Isochrysis_galbana.AAC.5
MGELGPHTPPSWANDADVIVREAASDAMRRLSEHGPDSPVPDRYRSGGSRQGPESDAIFRNTAQLLREEEQRRRAAFASMGESDSGREVYAAAVRQQLGRLNRKLGSGRGGSDPGARDGLPVEVRRRLVRLLPRAPALLSLHTASCRVRVMPCSTPFFCVRRFACPFSPSRARVPLAVQSMPCLLARPSHPLPCWLPSPPTHPRGPPTLCAVGFSHPQPAATFHPAPSSLARPSHCPSSPPAPLSYFR